MSQTTHIVVFGKVLSAAEEKRVQKAIQAIEQDAYVIGGWTKPEYRPGYVSVDGYVGSETKSKLYRAACAAVQRRA